MSLKKESANAKISKLFNFYQMAISSIPKVSPSGQKVLELAQGRLSTGYFNSVRNWLFAE